MRRFYEEAFSEGNLDLVDELVADDAIGYDPAQPEPTRGTEDVKQLISMYRSAFPDLSFEVKETLSDGDWVALRWVSSGTHEGELMGIAPTDEDVEVVGTDLSRIEDGKIVESRIVWDTLGMLRQIGAIPEMPAR